MKMRALITSLLAIALLGTFDVSSAATRTVTEDYVGSSQLTLGSACRSATVPINIGMACFEVKPGDENVRITVADDAVGEAGFFYIQYDAAGNCAGENPDPTSTEACPGSGIHCGLQNIVILPKVVRLTVWVDGVTGPLDCLVFEGKSSAGVGVAGTVTARFTS